MRRRNDIARTVASLIRDWEREKSYNEVGNLVVKTAALLSRVNDVPANVLHALDNVLSYDVVVSASSIYQVVHYLRELQNLDNLISANRELDAYE